MNAPETHAITGAFSYTGKYITQRLLARGKQVRTLTGHPNNPNPFGEQVRAFPFDFEYPDKLAKSLEGVTTLYNTYWVRFSHGSMTYEKAVANVKILFQAAREAGVQRVVHVSITNPSLDSPFLYFQGKARLEQELASSGLSHAIIRPAVIFGKEDVLINNITWLLRRFPLFPIFGSGTYSLRPIFVEDMADLVIQAGEQRDTFTRDAVGPETFTFEELVRLIARILHRRVLFLHLNPRLAFVMAKSIEPLVKDVLITREEVDGLMANLLISQQESTGQTRLSTWLEQHADTIGKRYASELQRHFRS